MTDLELRANAMLSELKAHISGLVDRCAVLAAELAQAQSKIKELETPKDKVVKLEHGN